MHQKTRKAYDEAGFQKDETPQEAVKRIFEHRTKRSEARYVINQVWRVSRGPDKEFIVYDRLTLKDDLAGNEERLSEMLGKYQMPKFRKQFDPTSGDVIATQVSGHDEVYDIPFSKAEIKKILDSGDSTHTAFTLDTGAQRFGGFSADDFINRSYEELVQIATGTAPAAAMPIVRPELNFKTPKDVEKESKQARDEEEEYRKSIREANERKAEIESKQLEEQRKSLMEERQRLMDEIIAKRQAKNEGKDASTVQVENNKGAFVEKTKIREDVSAIVKHEDGSETRIGGTEAVVRSQQTAENQNPQNNYDTGGDTGGEDTDKEVGEGAERKRGRKPRSQLESEER